MTAPLRRAGEFRRLEYLFVLEGLSRFSESEYGRFGSYFEYTMEKDKPLNVNYRLWLQDGLMKPKQVAALNANFVEPVNVTILE